MRAIAPLWPRLPANAGCLARTLPIVGDDLAATEATLRSALSQKRRGYFLRRCIGGGTRFCEGRLRTSGGSLEFWKVAIKPGRPFVFGRLGRKLFFGLPGNPASAMVTLRYWFDRLYLRLQSAADWSLPVFRAKLAEPLVNGGDRRHFMRVRRDAED